MNIHNRIEKLEGKVFNDGGSADACRCQRGVCKFEVIDDDREQAEMLEPEYCEVCGKRIEVIIASFQIDKNG